MIIFTAAVLLCSASHSLAYKKRYKHEVLELSDTCPKRYVDVEKYDVIDVKSMKENEARHSVSSGSSCMAYFETSLPGHGLCIRMHGVLIMSPHFRLEFLTGPYSPERIIERGTDWRKDWCFPNRLVAVKVTTSRDEEHVDRAAIYAFTVTNVTLDKVPRHYFMDSFVECDLEHELISGQKVHIESQRDPPVTSDLPRSCKMTFDSTSEDEYEQLCLRLEIMTSSDDVGAYVKAISDARKNLIIEGLNPRFYSTKEALNGIVACSEKKHLKLKLTRTPDSNIIFKASITSQWHPLWEKEASESVELQALKVVKGITYFIATIDSLVAVLVAFLASILRKPTGPWRRWAEHFNAQASAHAPQQYPAGDPAGNYGSMHTSKDGNYPELPPEGATPVLRERNEVLVEAHTY